MTSKGFGNRRGKEMQIAMPGARTCRRIQEQRTKKYTRPGKEKAVRKKKGFLHPSLASSLSPSWLSSWEEFEEYVEKAKTLPESTSNENKLILYGLYKQDTVGPVDTLLLVINGF
ncbi:unnamed protein product [Urochloa humidicola]